VLHPPWLRKYLFMLLLRDGNDPRRLIKHHKPRASCALVDGPNVTFHEISPFRPRCILRRNAPGV
jgi:hypothetical protein